jgi:hypothetical protein
MGGFPLFLGRYGRTRVARHRPGGHAGGRSSDRRPRWRVDTQNGEGRHPCRRGWACGTASRNSPSRVCARVAVTQQLYGGGLSFFGFWLSRVARGAGCNSNRDPSDRCEKTSLGIGKVNRADHPTATAREVRCGRRRMASSTADTGRAWGGDAVARGDGDGSGRDGRDRHGPDRFTTTRGAIGDGGALVARTPCGHEGRAYQGHDRQSSLEHDVDPPPEQRGGRRDPPLRTTRRRGSGPTGHRPCSGLRWLSGRAYSFTVGSPAGAINEFRAAGIFFSPFSGRLCRLVELELFRREFRG